jgi:hypothetical protein
MYSGVSPWQVAPLTSENLPVLTREAVSDVPAMFVADPFMLHLDRTWYMFFEVMNRHTRKGEIGLATSADGQHWWYRQIVLAEPFHLSYPYVFTWQGQHYMVPETYQAGAVRLYRAEPFPTCWRLVATLCQGPYLVDPSVFYYHGLWWLLLETSLTAKHDTLRLYHAAALLGPWQEHPQSPLIVGNGHIARPAGRVVCEQNTVLRYTQDCDPIYGAAVRAFAITTLTTRLYRECPCTPGPILSGSGAGWNADGMHHIDPHRLDNGRWLACVDGFAWHFQQPGESSSAPVALVTHELHA